MTEPIDDVSSLPGKKVTDHEENPIGEIKDIYAVEGDGQPMWVSIEASLGLGEKRTVLIPLARLKDEDGELRVPYSKGHIQNTPEIDASDGISDECDRQLRDHYGIDRADHELRTDNKSYATLVPEDEGTVKVAEDPDSLDTPDADKTDEETRERLEDVGSSEIRHVTADDVAAGGEDESGKDSEGDGGGGESQSSGGEREEGSSDGERDEGSSEGESEHKSEHDESKDASGESKDDDQSGDEKNED
jgi:PRC-barrel domain